MERARKQKAIRQQHTCSGHQMEQRALPFSSRERLGRGRKPTSCDVPVWSPGRQARLFFRTQRKGLKESSWHIINFLPEIPWVILRLDWGSRMLFLPDYYLERTFNWLYAAHLLLQCAH